ncbi:MAG: ATP-binding protein [Ignavibacteriaceae bacterium]|nr:ATP-binding protein [Ignavibacteriaceae bacterium]
MSNIENNTVVDIIDHNQHTFKGERDEHLKRVTIDVLITPLKIMALLIAVSGIFAMIFEVQYFSEYSLKIYATRLLATLSAFLILVFLNSKAGMKRPVMMVHLLLLVIIVSSGYMIYLIPKTIIVNAHIVGLVIFTSALFLSWEVKNQIIAAIYYNIVFAAAILLNDQSIYFLPNMYESVIFVLFLSMISVVGSAVNYKLRMQLAENSFKIMLSERKYRSIFENSAEGVFQSNIEGHFITVNNALSKILGYTKEELLNLNIATELYKDPSDREKIVSTLKKQKELKDYQVSLKKKDGNEVIVRLNDRLVSDREGSSIYFEGNLQDITAQVIAENNKQKAEQALRDEKLRSDMLAKEALHSSLMKSQFLANMSHEIRTPMNGIIGFLTLIEKEAYHNMEELKQFSISARKSAESLLDIINDILDVSKIESGKMQLVTGDFDLSEVIDESVSILSPKIREKDLTISKEIDENTLPVVHGDSTRMRQIFINLISNAVKFTEKGGIKIFVKTINTDSKYITLLCSVEDSGIGIPQNKIDTLFKPFSQVDASHTRQSGGSGLGLAICKEFVTMMGGEIGVRSEINKGSTFYFTIKLSPQTFNTPAASKSKISRVYDFKEETKESATQIKDTKLVRGKFKILLAEDNFINQKVCLRILNEAGYKADAVVNGFEAINAVKKQPYDLILMDVQMPECDGFTATNEIRKLGGQFKKLPIFAITAHALMGDKEKCLEAGMNDYISKPIMAEHLISTIDKWLEVNSSSKNKTVNNGGNYKMENIFDFIHLEKMSIGSVEFQKDLVITFIEDMDKRFILIQSYLDSGNLEKLVNEAHTIKGASLSVGANLVGRNAIEVEMTGKEKDLAALPEKLSGLKESIEKTKEILSDHFSLSES